jgi:hypothetical protein
MLEEKSQTAKMKIDVHGRGAVTAVDLNFN